MPDIGIKTDTTSGPNSDGILGKTPAEVKTFEIAFDSDDFGSGETISSVDDITITRQDGEAADLVDDSSSASGQAVQVTFSGGTLDKSYDVVLTVSTSAGQTLQGHVRLKINPP